MPKETKVGDTLQFTVQVKGKFGTSIDSKVASYEQQVKEKDQIYYERSFAKLRQNIMPIIKNDFFTNNDSSFVQNFKMIGMDYIFPNLRCYGEFKTIENDHFMFYTDFYMPTSPLLEGKLEPVDFIRMVNSLNQYQSFQTTEMVAYHQIINQEDITKAMVNKGVFDQYTSQGYSISALRAEYTAPARITDYDAHHYSQVNGVYVATHPSKSPVMFWNQITLYFANQENFAPQDYIDKFNSDNACTVRYQVLDEFDPYLSEHFFAYYPEYAQMPAFSKPKVNALVSPNVQNLKHASVDKELEN